MPDLPGPDVDLPDEVVEAAARALYAELWPDGTWENEPLELILEWRGQARVMLAAALPAIRRHIADEISRTVGITAGTWGGLRDPALVKADAMGIVRGDGYCVCDDGPMLDCGISTHRAAARVARGGSDGD